jgi:hypothetical protein
LNCSILQLVDLFEYLIATLRTDRYHHASTNRQLID